jgi:hypothetical protein
MAAADRISAALNANCFIAFLLHALSRGTRLEGLHSLRQCMAAHREEAVSYQLMTTGQKAGSSTLAIFVGRPSGCSRLQPASSTPGEFLRLRYAMPKIRSHRNSARRG